MVLINKLGVEKWVMGNHTDNTGEGISGTIYTEEKMVNAKNLSGYTLKFKLYDQDRFNIYSEDCDILVAGSGTWEYLPVPSVLNFQFIGDVEIQLTKSDEEVTAIGVNGSAKLRIR